MKKLLLIISLTVFGLLGLLGISAALSSGANSSDPKIEKFAQCLSEKGVKMFGAYWCPHCQAQKKLFGNSFKQINYIECTQQPKLCEEQKIAGYPTWIFSDGSRISGEATFKQLGEKAFCPAPN